MGMPKTISADFAPPSPEPAPREAVRYALEQHMGLVRLRKVVETMGAYPPPTHAHLRCCLRRNFSIDDAMTDADHEAFPLYVTVVDLRAHWGSIEHDHCEHPSAPSFQCCLHTRLDGFKSRCLDCTRTRDTSRPI